MHEWKEAWRKSPDKRLQINLCLKQNKKWGMEEGEMFEEVKRTVRYIDKRQIYTEEEKSSWHKSGEKKM